MMEYDDIIRDTLIIKYSKDDLIGKLISKRNYKIENMYRGNGSVFLRFLRRIMLKYKLPLYQLWFNNNILKYNVKNILIFESLLSPLLVIWINKHLKVSIHVWYWNIVKNTVKPDSIRFKNCKIWTFSREDARNYKMRFNPPPYFCEIKCDNRKKIYDVVFVGKDKGRLRNLIYWNSKFINKNMKTIFHITPDRLYKHNRYYSKTIPYSESIKLSCQSKAVLDLIEINNSGQSMRMMESLFLSNKVITNNVLIKDYDFYNPKNIFILNYDNFDNIENFLNSEYETIDSTIIKNYDFDEFFFRFFNKKKYWWNYVNKDFNDE